VSIETGGSCRGSALGQPPFPKELLFKYFFVRCPLVVLAALLDSTIMVAGAVPGGGTTILPMLLVYELANALIRSTEKEMTGLTGIVFLLENNSVYLLLLLGLTRLPAAERGLIRVETGLLLSAIISDILA